MEATLVDKGNLRMLAARLPSHTERVPRVRPPRVTYERVDECLSVGRQVSLRMPQHAALAAKWTPLVDQADDRYPRTRERHNRRDDGDALPRCRERNERLRRPALEHNVQIGLSALARFLEKLPVLEFGCQDQQRFVSEVVDSDATPRGKTMSARHDGQHAKGVEETAGQWPNIAQYPDTVEQPDAELSFQITDLTRQRGLADM